MTRDNFTTAVKREAFHRAGEKCERCSAPVRHHGDSCRFNHRIACFWGGKGTVENCEVLCLQCDHAQTHSRDPAEMSKARRIDKKRAGYRPKNYKPMPFGKGSKFKQKIPSKRNPRGGVVRR